MHLREVTLRDFRCFDELTVELHPRLTVLVAENGGGKTAVLDGIALGLAPVLRLLSSANQRLSGPGIKDTDFRILPGSGRIELKAPLTQVVLKTVSGWTWDEWKPSEQGVQPPDKIGQGDLSALLEVPKSYATDSVKTLPVFAYYGAQRGLIEIPKRLRVNRTKEVNYTYPTSGLFGALDAQSDFKEMLKWFDVEETSEWREQKESDGYVRSVPLEAVRVAVTEVFGKQSYHSPHFDSKHKFCVRHHGEPGKLQVSQLSQGYQSMLALVMDFARRLALANPHLDGPDLPSDPVCRAAVAFHEQWGSFPRREGDPSIGDLAFRGPALAPAIMLIDEVDLHLHPSWQQRVLGDLMRAFPHTQFIVTTHSPQVLTTVRRESIRILEKDASGKWRATVPAHSPLGQESADALARIMGTHPRPELPLLDDVHTYEQLARAGRAHSPEAQAVLGRLNAAGFEFNEADWALLTYLGSRKQPPGGGAP